MLQGRVCTSSRVLSSLPSSHSSIGPARGVLACNHRAQQRYGRGACGTAPLTGWQALQSLRPDLRQRHAVVVASSKGGDSSSSGGTQSSKQQEQDEEPAAEEEEEGETFTRYCFEGLLSSALIVGAGNLLGGSGAWSWDAPADGLNTILTCALVPTLMLLAICLPTYPAGQATADTKFLEDVYKRSASLTIVVGDDDVRSRNLTLTPSMSLQSVSSALALVQVFLARPWSPSRPLPIAGFIIKQTMTQAALECLLRGTLVLGLQGVVRDAVAQADSSSWLFWIKFFGLANNTNSLAAAVLLATLLLTPFTLFQTKAVQEFARAAVNKPVRDQGLAVMTSSTSVSEFSQKLQALSQSLGAEPAALSALLADAPFPLASVASGKSERGSGSKSAAEGGAEGTPSESAAAAIAESAQASAATQEDAITSRPLGSGSLAAGETSNVGGGAADAAGAASGVIAAASGAGFSSKVVSKEAQKQLQRSEAETAAAFAALRAARTPEELEAGSLALLDAASNSGEAALAALIESNIAKDDAEEQLSEKTVAAMASVQALRATQRRLKAAAAEAELASSEDLRVAEFDALTRVQTQEDRLVAWVLGTHLMSCMVAVNAAFLASGSLAVSFGTAWMVRVLPALVVEVTRQLRQDAMQGQGKA